MVVYKYKYIYYATLKFVQKRHVHTKRKEVGLHTSTLQSDYFRNKKTIIK